MRHHVRALTWRMLVLLQLKNYIDDTEDYINLQLDNHRNQLLQLEIVLTIATFIMAMFSVVVSALTHLFLFALVVPVVVSL